MATLRIDENALSILNQVKKKMRDGGIESPSHSEAIRWLHKKWKTEVLHTKKYRSFSDIVDTTLSDIIDLQIEVCIRRYVEKRQWLAFFIISSDDENNHGLFSPKYYDPKDMLTDLMSILNKEIKEKGE